MRLSKKVGVLYPTFKKLPKYQQDEIKERYNLYYSKRGK